MIVHVQLKLAFMQISTSAIMAANISSNYEKHSVKRKEECLPFLDYTTDSVDCVIAGWSRIVVK